MSDKNQEQEKIESGKDNHIEIDRSKRKFSKAGVTAPVLLGLASRPSWVQAIDANCSFTQALSGNTSPGGPNPECIPGRSSTVSPGIFAGDGGGAKWEEFGVGHLRDKPFSEVFGVLPEIKLKPEFTRDDPKGVTTLERALKAHKKDFEISEDFQKGGSLHNEIFHFIGAYLMASSTSSPVEEGGLPLIYPYTPSQIANNWKLEDRSLYPILQNLQDVHLDVSGASDVTGITLP